MKKITCAKITLLFLFSLCVLSLFIINLRNEHYESKGKELLDNVLENIESEERNKEEEKIIFQDGSIGMIIIPSIEVRAPIYEGTSKDILKYAVRSFCKYKLMGAEIYHLLRTMKAHMLTILQE